MTPAALLSAGLLTYVSVTLAGRAFWPIPRPRHLITRRRRSGIYLGGPR